MSGTHGGGPADGGTSQPAASRPPSVPRQERFTGLDR